RYHGGEGRARDRNDHGEGPGAARGLDADAYNSRPGPDGLRKVRSSWSRGATAVAKSAQRGNSPSFCTFPEMKENSLSELYFSFIIEMRWKRRKKGPRLVMSSLRSSSGRWWTLNSFLRLGLKLSNVRAASVAGCIGKLLEERSTSFALATVVVMARAWDQEAL